MRALLAAALVLALAGPALAAEQLRLNVQGPPGGPPPSSQVLRTLTVAKAGNGTGTVTGTGITCGVDCVEVVNNGTSVTLTPSALSGSVFAGWSGACAGSGGCTVLLDNDKAVTAAFTFTGWPLAWNDNSTDEANFELERRSPCGSGTFGFLTAPGANVVTVVDASAIAGQQYEYRIRAVNAGGPSAYSNTLCTP